MPTEPKLRLVLRAPGVGGTKDWILEVYESETIRKFGRTGTCLQTQILKPMSFTEAYELAGKKLRRGYEIISEQNSRLSEVRPEPHTQKSEAREIKDATAFFFERNYPELTGMTYEE